VLNATRWKPSSGELKSISDVIVQPLRETYYLILDLSSGGLIRLRLVRKTQVPNMH